MRIPALVSPSRLTGFPTRTTGIRYQIPLGNCPQSEGVQQVSPPDLMPLETDSLQSAIRNRLLENAILASLSNLVTPSPLSCMISGSARTRPSINCGWRGLTAKPRHSRAQCGHGVKLDPFRRPSKKPDRGVAVVTSESRFATTSMPVR